MLLCDYMVYWAAPTFDWLLCRGSTMLKCARISVNRPEMIQTACGGSWPVMRVITTLQRRRSQSPRPKRHVSSQQRACWVFFKFSWLCTVNGFPRVRLLYYCDSLNLLKGEHSTQTILTVATGFSRIIKPVQSTLKAWEFSIYNNTVGAPHLTSPQNGSLRCCSFH